MSITKQATSTWAKWEHLIAKLLSPLFPSKTEHSPPTSNSKNDHHHTHITAHRNAFSLISRSLTSHKLLLTGLIVLTIGAIHSSLKKRKLLLASLLLIIIGAPIIFLSLKYQSKTEAAWMDDNFTYRQTINITNSGSTQTDFQVSIGIGTSALINAGKMKSDCSDIRVTDNNGKVLPYWIETGGNGCNSTTTNVWTKVPTIPTSGATLYVYYGNPSASNTQNGEQVFEFFDDFSGTSLDSSKWTNSSSASVSISNGIATFTETNDVEGTNIYATAYYASGSIVFEARFNATTQPTSEFAGISLKADNATGTNKYKLGQGSNQASFWYYNGSWTQATGSPVSASGYHVFGVTYTGSAYQGYLDGSQVQSNMTNSLFAKQVPAITPGLQSGVINVDWFRVRKYAATPPSVAAPTNEEKSQGPVAYWKFDEGYGTTANDSTPNNNNGSFGVGSSAPTWQTEDQCISGKCLKFNGNDYVTVSNNSALSGMSQITQEAWVYMNSFGGSPVVIGKQNSYDLYFGTDGKLYTDYKTASGGIVSLNRWTHIAMTYDGSNTRLYIDGVQTAIQANSGAIPTSTTPLEIGRWAQTTEYVTGFIDDVKIYPYARSAAQIKSDYAAGLAHAGAAKGISASMGSNSKNSSALSNGLVGYWKLDETSSPAQDSSGVGNTGTWNGNVSGVAGRYGIGASFDGNGDYVGVADSTASVFDFRTNPFTLSVWVKTTLGETADWIGIVSKFAGDNFWIQLDPSANKYVACGWDGASYMTTTKSINDGNWHNIVCERTGSTNGVIYVDGTQVSSSNAQPNNDLNDNTEIRIGSLTSGSPRYFTGTIDEVRIYNRAFSPTEIRQLADWAPGPVGYWNFEEGTGNTVNDSSGVGNTGTWNGTGSHWTNGKYGKAGKFNGTDDYVELPYSTTRDFNTGNFTVSTWINMPDQTNRPIIEWGSYATDGFILRTNESDTNRISVYLGDDTHYYWTYAFTANTWYHIVIVRTSATTLEAFVNGVRQGTKTIPADTAVTAGGGVTRIGQVTSGGVSGGVTWKGFIDDVRIYNYARTQKQIIEDMNAGHPAVGSPVGSAVGHWKFDEGQGTVANNSGSGGSTLNGTLTSMASPATATSGWTQSGKFGKALNFDGSDDFVDTGRNSSLLITGDITISAWLKPTNLSNYYSIVDQTETTGWTGLYYIMTEITTGKIRFYRGNGTSEASVTSNSGIGTNWSHIVVTMSGTTVNIYINGVLDKTGTLNTTIADTGENILIGKRSDANYRFNGVIDEVKIYNYSLTEDEVKLDYNHGAAMVLGTLSVNTGNTAPPTAASQEYCIPGDTTSCAPPVGRWDFQEGIGSTANDTSGNGYNGAMTGATWTNGKIGKALSFSQTGDKVQTSNSIITGTGDLTITAWINRSSAGTIDYIAGNYGAGSCVDGIEFYGTTDNKLKVHIASGISSSASLNANNWYHVAVTRTSGSIQLYINGVADGSGTLASSIGGNCNFVIGNGPNYTSEKFDGKIDNVRVFDYARSPAQIAWDYNRGAPVGHWKFDEAQGTTAYDSTDPPAGGGNNGNINIGASGTQTTAGTITSPTDGTGAWYNGRTGKLNYSLSFDGTDDSVSMSNYTTLSGSSNASMAYWFKMNSLSADQHLGGYQISTGGRYVFAASFYNAAGCGGTSCINAFARTTNGQAYSTNIPLTDTNWHHVAFTWDGTNLVIYLDGKLQSGQGASTTGSLIAPEGLIFGKDITNIRYLNGQIDDVKIYNYALTPSQVKLLYNNGAAYFGPSVGSP